MLTLSTSLLKPGMVPFDDVYNSKNEILVKSLICLNADKIKLLVDNNIEEINIAEPTETNTTHYSHLHASEHFQQFNKIYKETLSQYLKLMHTLNTGLEINFTTLLSLRDTILKSVHGGEQLLDYLYNLMPNENEITYNHCFNCGLMCYIFADWCDFSDEDKDNITLAGFLFDIGKSKIDDELLWKPDKLTPEEYIQMQHHIHLGYEIVKAKQLPPHIISVMIMHHERCDGSGYPAGLTKNKIDPFALIAAIADTYEAMTHPRSHRTALTPFQAIRIFENQGFDKYGDHTNTILYRIAKMYEDRNVILTGNINARIIKINENNLSKPAVFTSQQYVELNEIPDTEIIRMA